MSKILHLTLKKEWFDLILSGKKPIEYREYTKYWIARLMREGKPRTDFDVIHCRNGYSGNSPAMRVSMGEIKIIHSRHHQPVNGEQLTADRYFAIYLGSVLTEGKNQV